MTADERHRIEAKVLELELICQSDDGKENQKARLGLIGSLLMAYPVAAGSEESGKARAMAYLVALDDVPPWAVSEAIRKWHRRECGEKQNYSFAPAPAELRLVCMTILDPARLAIGHLKAVLNAMTLERAMDPKPIQEPEVKSADGKVYKIGIRRL